MRARWKEAALLLLGAESVLGCGGTPEEQAVDAQSELGECTAFSQGYFSISAPGDMALKPLATHFAG